MIKRLSVSIEKSRNDPVVYYLRTKMMRNDLFLQIIAKLDTIVGCEYHDGFSLKLNTPSSVEDYGNLSIEVETYPVSNLLKTVIYFKYEDEHRLIFNMRVVHGDFAIEEECNEINIIDENMDTIYNYMQSLFFGNKRLINILGVLLREHE